MGDILESIGFDYIPWNEIDDLQRGDILWRSSHTEIYIGDNQQVGAHGQNPSASHPNRSSATGDQGDEISVQSFNGSWEGDNNET